jgi:hypothetical protein
MVNLLAITATVRCNLKCVLPFQLLSLHFADPVEEASKIREYRHSSWQGNLKRNILPPSPELL